MNKTSMTDLEKQVIRLEALLEAKQELLNTMKELLMACLKQPPAPNYVSPYSIGQAIGSNPAGITWVNTPTAGDILTASNDGNIRITNWCNKTFGDTQDTYHSSWTENSKFWEKRAENLVINIA